MKRGHWITTPNIYTLAIQHSWLENGPCEDVFPIQNGDVPASYVSLPEGNMDTKDLQER